MRLVPGEVPRRVAYRFLIGSIVPRPVAWISTVGADGTRNLAPFSYFMGVGADPPMLAVSINAHRGQRKDTLRNIEETGEFVVNIASEELLERMVATSGEYPYQLDEFEWTGLHAAPCDFVKAPRVDEAPISMECRLVTVVTLGNPPNTTGLVVGEVLAWHVRDEVLTDGVPDMAKVRPIARMIDDQYLLTRERRVVPRPRVGPEDQPVDPDARPRSS